MRGEAKTRRCWYYDGGVTRGGPLQIENRERMEETAGEPGISGSAEGQRSLGGDVLEIQDPNRQDMYM